MSVIRAARETVLFAPLAPEPEKLEVTLARIRGVVETAQSCASLRTSGHEVMKQNAQLCPPFLLCLFQLISSAALDEDAHEEHD